jgi:hypothetical protein
MAVYQAPEVRFDPATTAEQVDVFSLGAIAYHVLSGQPPAANALELGEKLRASKGLALAAVIDGAEANQDQRVRWATHPEVSERLPTAAYFLRLPDEVEDALTRPAAVPDTPPVDPARARDGDVLEEASATWHSNRRLIIALQEELDWQCYRLYGLTADELTYPLAEVPGIDLGQRAFEIVVARQVAAGKTSTTWFERHRCGADHGDPRPLARRLPGARPAADRPDQRPRARRQHPAHRAARIQAAVEHDPVCRAGRRDPPLLAPRSDRELF